MYNMLPLLQENAELQRKNEKLPLLDGLKLCHGQFTENKYLRIL